MENGDNIKTKQKHIYDKDSVPASGKPSVSLGFFQPGWMKQDQKMMLLVDDVYKRGYLSLDDDNYWEFVTRGRDGRIA